MKAPGTLLAALAIPLSLGQWTEISVPGKKMPIAEALNGSLKLSTRDAAGGYALLFPKAYPSLKASWSWDVAKFPVSQYGFPISKGQDDFAIRVGFLVESDRTEMRVPPAIKKQLKDRGAHLSYVVFYNSVPDTGRAHACEMSPYNDHVVNCFLPARAQPTTVTVSPLLDLANTLNGSDRKSGALGPLVLGLWVFADSDNGRTISEGTLKDLRIEP